MKRVFGRRIIILNRGCKQAGYDPNRMKSHVWVMKRVFGKLIELRKSKYVLTKPGTRYNINVFI